MTYTYQTDGRGTEIAFNRIHHNFALPPGGAGIYLDDTTQGHVVHHNLVYATPEALAMNPPAAGALNSTTVFRTNNLAPATHENAPK